MCAGIIVESNVSSFEKNQPFGLWLGDFKVPALSEIEASTNESIVLLFLPLNQKLLK